MCERSRWVRNAAALFSDATLGYGDGSREEILSPVRAVGRLSCPCLSRPKMRPQNPRFFFGSSSVSAAITMSDGSLRCRDDSGVGASRWRWLPSATPPALPLAVELGNMAASCPDVEKLCSSQISVGAVPRAKYSVMTRSHARIRKLAGEPAHRNGSQSFRHLERVGLVLRRRLLS